MRESVDAICGLAIIAATIVLALVLACAWEDQQLTPLDWQLCISLFVVIVVALTMILVQSFREDKLPDYLREAIGQYFSRDGFCLIPMIVEQDRLCILQIYFQSQYSLPCDVWVRFGPRKDLLSPIEAHFNCPSAGYGVFESTLAVPVSPVGRNVEFDIGMDVVFPKGRGQRVRYGRGTAISRHQKRRRLLRCVKMALLFVGFRFRSSRVTLYVPGRASTQLTDSPCQRMRIFSQLGDFGEEITQAQWNGEDG